MKTSASGTLLLLFLVFIGISNGIAQTPVPFYYYQSLIFVKAKINNGRTNFLFLINTGANTTVISKKTADILKLPVVRDVDSVIGTAGREPVSICKLRALSIGDAQVKDFEVTKRDLSKFVTYNGQQIDGIIGTDFLKNYAFTIDFVAKKLLFANKKIAVGKQKNIPFTVVDGIPRIVAKLDDTLVTYLHYNSGVSMESSRNNYFNISYTQWVELKKLNPHINHTTFFSGKGVGGDVYMQVVKISNVQLNKNDVRNPYIIIQNKEGYFERDDAIGFFGNNVLEKYNRVSVDFIGNNIVFQSSQKPMVASKKGTRKK